MSICQALNKLLAIMRTFGERLKYLIEEQKINQKILAKNVGLSESLIGRYLKNEREPGISKAEQIADYFGVDLNWLITGRTFEERLASRPHKKKQPIINNWLFTVNNSHTDNLENCISEIINKLKKMTPNQRKKVLKFINEFILTEDE